MARRLGFGCCRPALNFFPAPHFAPPGPLSPLSSHAQGSYALFWLVYYCTLAVGIVLAYTIAALSPNLDVANAALPTLVVTFLFFAGLLLRWESIPDWWRWYGARVGVGVVSIHDLL